MSGCELDDATMQVAILISMGYPETYVESAINIHKRSVHGTNWNLSVLVEIIDRIQTRQQQNIMRDIMHNNSKHSEPAVVSLSSDSNSYIPVLKKITRPRCIKKTDLTHSNNYKNQNVFELYMKAISLYENKHYEECARTIKDILRKNPNHDQAIQLSKELVQQRLCQYNNDNIKQKKKKKKKTKRMSFGWRKRNKIHPCKIEFKRFIQHKIQFNAYYPDLEEKFMLAKYDDIRLLKDFDANMLEKEIGLKTLHCTLFMRKTKIFIDQVCIFKKWLRDIVVKQNRKNLIININILSDLFENNGISTLEALYRNIECKKDLDVMMKSSSKYNISNITDVLWNEMELRKRKPASPSFKFEEEEKHLSLPPLPQDTKSVIHYGFTDDGDEESTDESIEDMYFNLSSNIVSIHANTNR